MSGGRNEGGMHGEESVARTEVLRRIRAANRSISSREAAEEELQAIARGYRREGELQQSDVLLLFERRVLDYDATLTICSPLEVAAQVGRRLNATGRRRIVIPAGVPDKWLPCDMEFIVDDALGAVALDQMDGVLTGATVAIAETGTLVLQNVPGQGRRALSLIPDYHLCVLRAEDVVETVAEAMRRLQPTCCLPTTFVSGPSATADIEMTRIKGVHGPRVLDVIVMRAG